MRKSTILLLALLLFAIVSDAAFAKKKQDTELKKQKEELKKWKKRKAAMRPLQLKDLIEENHKLKTSNTKLAAEIKATNEELQKLIALKLQIEAQKNEHSKQGTETLGGGYEGETMMGLDGFSKDDWAIDKNGNHYIKGVVFKVQIGAYKKRDLGDVLGATGKREVFEQDRSAGVNIYTLWHFRDYWKANQFKKELRAMGLKDAWVVCFRDGKRVPLKDVLKEVVKKK